MDVLVADFRDVIEPASRQIIALLSRSDFKTRMAGADALSKLSGHGNPSIF